MDIKRTYEIESTLTAQKVCQLINNGKINDLPLKIPHAEAVGSPIDVTNSLKMNYDIYAEFIDSTRVLILYDTYSGYNFFAVVATISGTSITLGTPVMIESASYSSSKCAKLLDSTHMIISYYNGSGNTGIRSAVLVITDTTIIVGNIITVAGTSTYGVPNISIIDSTRALITFTGGSTTDIEAVVLSVAGTTITIGTKVVVFPNRSTYQQIVVLNQNLAVLSFVATNQTNEICCIPIFINNTTLTVGSYYYSSDTGCTWQAIDKIDQNRAFITYTIGSTMKAYIVNMAGTSLFTTRVVEIGSGFTSFLRVRVLSLNLILILYRTSNYVGYFIMEYSNSLDKIDVYPTIILTDYALSQTLNMCANLNNLFIAFDSLQIGNTRVARLLCDTGKILGVSQNSTGSVILKGISRSHIGLITGSKYYFDSDGIIGTDNTGTFLGVAISDTEIFIPEPLMSDGRIENQNTVKRTYEVDETLTAEKVCQLIDNGKINDLPLLYKHGYLYTGSLTYGSQTQGDTYSTSYVASTKLDDTHVLICYGNTFNVITITNGLLTFGTPIVLSGLNAMDISLVTLDSSRVFMSYEDTSTAYMYGVVLTYANGTLTAGTKTQLSTYGSQTKSLLISDNLVIVNYISSSNYLHALPVNISGSTIMLGSDVVVYSSSGTQGLCAEVLDINKIIVTFGGVSNNWVYGCVLTISNGVITVGSPSALVTPTSSESTIAVLDPTHCFVCVSDSNSYPRCIRITIVGTNITAVSTSYTPHNEISMYRRAKTLDSTHVLLSYIKTSNNINAEIFTIIDNSFVANGQSVITTGSTTYTQLVQIDGIHFVLIYKNASSNVFYSNYLSTGYSDVPNDKTGKPFGIAVNTTGDVILKGISKGHSNLIPGSKYYYDKDGNLSTNSFNTFIGIAISDTEIFIPDYIIS